MRYVMVNYTGDLSIFPVVRKESEYNKMCNCIDGYSTTNPVICTGDYRKGLVKSKFNGRPVRLFDGANGLTYEVFTDGSARPV